MSGRSICACSGVRVFTFPRSGPHRNKTVWRCTNCGHREVKK